MDNWYRYYGTLYYAWSGTTQITNSKNQTGFDFIGVASVCCVALLSSVGAMPCHEIRNGLGLEPPRHTTSRSSESVLIWGRPAGTKARDMAETDGFKPPLVSGR
jgi:hypothetical protein